MLAGGASPVRIEALGCADGVARWRVSNLSDEIVWLSEAWLPHGRFRGALGRTSVDAKLVPGSGVDLELAVVAHELPGTVVENAFLILRVRTGVGAWRVFARMRIEFGDATVPVVEVVTAQRLE